MSQFNIWSAIIGIIGIFSFNPMEILSTKDSFLWVNSAKVPCTGVAPMTCLQISRGEDFNNTWELFYSEIDGFQYEPGYIYKLQVKEIQLDPKTVPADDSSIKYELIKIISQEPDPKLRLNDIWLAKSIFTESVNNYEVFSSDKIPYLEINFARNTFIAQDGCNQLKGEVKRADAQYLEFGEIVSTDMACQNMELPLDFMKAMTLTRQYKLENLQLLLFDQDGKEVLRFRKID